MASLGGAPICPTCSERVYFSDEKNYLGRKWHKKCFKCTDCQKVLETNSAHLTDEEVLICNGCQRKQSSTSNGQPQKQAYINKEDADCCPRCGKRVYFAEQKLGLGRKWHRACFCCATCKKSVDSTSAADHEGELYCRPCYGKNFGPKGYGFAGGASGLSMDTGKAYEVSRQDSSEPTSPGTSYHYPNVPQTAQAYAAPLKSNNQNGGGVTNGGGNRPKWGGGNYCPRCDKQVFVAEEKKAAGNVYHKSCFNCGVCHKSLDSNNITEKENEIYCKSCYGKQFGPKGYGYGSGAGTLQMS